jgi:geranylgeranyl diphosphate synthase type II
MLIHLLQHSSDQERERLCSLLSCRREERTATQVCWMHQLMVERGSIQHARQIANGLAGAALHEYSLLFAHLEDSPDKQFLEEIVPWVIERDVA